jgi:hypothetical protein
LQRVAVIRLVESFNTHFYTFGYHAGHMVKVNKLPEMLNLDVINK